MKKGKLIVFLFLLGILTGFGQSDKEKKASKAMQKEEFRTAAKLYEEILELTPGNAIAMKNAVNAYLADGDNQGAEKWLQQLATMKGATAGNKFMYAQTLMANAKYDDAKNAFADFAISAPQDSRAKFINNNPDYIETLLRISPQYTLSNLPVINSDKSDMCAMYYGKGIIFASERGDGNNKNYYDLYFSSFLGEENYEDPIRMKSPLNSNLHDGPISISADQKYIYVTRSDQKGGSCNCGKDKTNHIKIMEGAINDGIAEKMTLFEFAQDGYSVGHPAISPDGNTIVFASSMPGGFGESDLYITTKTEKGWSNPVNMGKDINTPGRELFPYIAKNGELYFSTDGRIGFGGLDIYMATKTGDRYTGIVNLGMPLNSGSDDFGISFNAEGTKGFVTSNRSGGKGSDDIYAFTKVSKMNMEVTIFDAVTKEELAAGQVELFDLNRKTLTIRNSDDFGASKFDLDANTSYKIKAKKEGYKAKEVSFKTMGIIAEKQTVKVPLRREGGIVLIISVKDLEGNMLADAAITIEETISKLKKTTKTDASGKATVTILPDRQYKVLATKRVPEASISYSVNSEKISTENVVAPFTLYATIAIEKFVEGTVTEIPNIYYDVNSSGIRKDAILPLEKIVTLMKKNPKLEIEIRSHTDSRGDDEVNLNLSSTRASSVAQYIINRGVSANRITSKGYGETELKNDCVNGANCTESQHQENRRTEFKMVKVK